MSDEYRKPTRPDRPTEKRGTVAKQAEPPHEGARMATGSDPRNRIAFEEYAADVRAEQEASRRSADIGMRVLGGVLIAIAVVILFTYREELATLGTIAMSARGGAILGVAATLGPWLVAFGNGGVGAMRDTPLWYRWGAGLVTLFGMCAMGTGAVMPIVVALLELTL